MLIRLIPPASQPTVLFKLVFQNLQETLQTPIAWVNQLAALDSDDLEIPELMHALDKAVGVQSMLEQVTFDLVDQKIKCIFLDGGTEEWDITSCFQGSLEEEACRRKVDLVRRLNSVIEDVNESAVEMDRERKRQEQQKEQRRIKEEEQLEAAKQDEGAISSGRKNRPGHKKQRSLLMNLVSSLLPLSLNSPRSPRSPFAWSSSPSTPRSTSPASSIRSSSSDKATHTQIDPAASTLSRSATLPSPGPQGRRPVSTSSLSSSLAVESSLPIVIVAPPLPPPLSPRALRRRARSSLVDAFRLYVLPELNRRLRYSHSAGSPVSSPVAIYGSESPALYYTWIVGSTLKRVDSRLSEIGKELKAELDAVGIELSTLSLAGLGVRSIANVEPHISPDQSLPRSLPSLSGDSSEGDAGSRSETGGDTLESTETIDGENLSEVTLIDSNAPSIGGPLTVHFHLPKSSSDGDLAPSVIAFPPSMYLTTSSSSDLLTPASISVSRPEIPLSENLYELLTQHNDFSSLHLRLTHLLLMSHTRTATAASDIAQREAVLEVRARRRSWLNKVLKVHGSSEGSSKMQSVNWSGAMASPFRPSGLGRYSYSSDEWECDPCHHLKASRVLPFSTLVTEVFPNSFDHEGDNGSTPYFYRHRRKRSLGDTNVDLFTVCEEEFLDDSLGEPSAQSSVLQRRRYLDFEIDEDDEDEDEGDDTDIDPLVGIEFDGPDNDDMLPRPSRRQFLQRETYHSIGKPKISNTSSQTGISMHMNAGFPKGASDPFDGPAEDFVAPLALVAAANITKRIKAEGLSDNVSDVVQ